MTSTAPAAAYHDFLRERAPAAHDQRRWSPTDGPMPAIFLSHGATSMLEDPQWMDQLFTWSQELPKPTAILIVSAHWESAGLMLSATDRRTPLVYDFGGRAPVYYEMTYDSPDASALAARVAALMPDTEPLHQHTSRGLDHGAWIPLKIMYPWADVPVLQMSIPTHDSGRLLDIGHRLQALRHEGVLVFGSGTMTHGLPFLTRENFVDGVVPSWSTDFDRWAADVLARGDLEALAAYESVAPAARYAHPTPDHYLPLFVTLGAATRTEVPVQTTVEGFRNGLSTRSFQVD